MVFYGSEVESGSIGEDETIRFEVLVAGKENGVEHGLVEKEVTHPFRDDDIEFFDWEICFFEFALHEGDS